MGCCTGMMRVFLIVFNIFFWLSGAAILGVGVWFLVDKNIGSYFTVIELDTDDSYFKYASYILIAFGSFIFLVGFCGCCGAIRGSKCLLGFYIFFLVLIIGGEVAAAVLMILYRMEAEKEIDSILQKSIKEKYNNHTTLREAWDLIQIKFDCCGYAGPSDYSGNAYLTKEGLKVPYSCCILTNHDAAMGDAKKAAPLNGTVCQNDLTNKIYINTAGCKTTLLDMAIQYSSIIMGIGIGIGAIEIFGIVFAICVCRQVDENEKYN